MSITDDVVQIRAIAFAESELIAQVRQIKQAQLELGLELVGVLGSAFGTNTILTQSSSKVDVHLENAMAAMQNYKDAILDAAQAIESAAS